MKNRYKILPFYEKLKGVAIASFQRDIDSIWLLPERFFNIDIDFIHSNEMKPFSKLTNREAL